MRKLGHITIVQCQDTGFWWLYTDDRDPDIGIYKYENTNWFRSKFR